MLHRASDFRQLLDCLLDQVVVLGPDLRVCEANHRFLEFCGKPLAAILGEPCHFVCHGCATPCDEAATVCSARVVLRTGRPAATEHFHEGADGRRIFVDERSLPLLDENGQVRWVVQLLRDITALRRPPNDLQRNLQGAEWLIGRSHGGEVVLNADYRIARVNAAASQWFGSPPLELLGRDIFELLGPGARLVFSELQAAVRPGQEPRLWVELTLQPTEEPSHQVEVAFSPRATPERPVLYLRDVVGGHRVQHNLIRAYQFLSSLFENSTDGVIAADTRGVVTVFNKGAEELLGYTADEVVGKINVACFYPEGVAQEIMRKLRSDEFGGRGRLLPHRITGLAKNGEEVPIVLSASLVYEGGRELASVGFFYDMRGHLRAQEELLRSEAKFRSLFQTVLHGVFFSGRDGRFLDFNPALQAVLGYEDRDELLAKNLASDVYVNPEDRLEFQRLVERDGYVKDWEVRFKKRNGEVLTTLMTAHPMRDGQGNIVGYQGLVVDITERHRLRQQLLQAEKMATLGTLAAGVAHEINNPLGGIYVYAHLLLEKTPPDDPRRAFMERIVRESARCKDIVQGLLRFSRPTEPHFKPTSVNAALRNVLDLLGDQALFQNITIRRELDESVAQVVGDAPQLEQVFTNIVLNAAEAMSGRGTLTLATRRADDPTLVEVVIADTGPGIRPEHVQRIFEPFFTTKEPAKFIDPGESASRKSGVGLGLALTYGIIVKHRGQIQVKTELGKGTAFHVRLPAAKQEG